MGHAGGVEKKGLFLVNFGTFGRAGNLQNLTFWPKNDPSFERKSRGPKTARRNPITVHPSSLARPENPPEEIRAARKPPEEIRGRKTAREKTSKIEKST
jgi:hypothetical protein